MTAQTSVANVNQLSSLIWNIAEILRGHFKQSEYGKIILPFVLLRRLDAILEPTKEAVLQVIASLPDDIPEVAKDQVIRSIIGDNIKVFNLSKLTLKSIYGQNAEQIHANLIEYIRNFNVDVCDIFIDKFRFPDQLVRLDKAGILYQVLEKIINADLHPDTVSNQEMGYLFEELIRKFSEISNETAGEHFTPREVIRLIVDLILVSDTKALTTSKIIRTVYDPACGTGGMLSITEQRLRELNHEATVDLYGQEINPEAYATCKSDMLITGHDASQIAFGNTLTNDAHTEGNGFHYIISNPPYGVDWKSYKDAIEAEAQSNGFNGRFGAGLPRVSDGQLLFLMHMISKMRNDEAGSRIGIVMNGSPLFTGGAGSGKVKYDGGCWKMTG